MRAFNLLICIAILALVYQAYCYLERAGFFLPQFIDHVCATLPEEMLFVDKTFARLVQGTPPDTWANWLWSKLGGKIDIPEKIERFVKSVPVVIPCSQRFTNALSLDTLDITRPSSYFKTITKAYPFGVTFLTDVLLPYFGSYKESIFRTIVCLATTLLNTVKSWSYDAVTLLAAAKIAITAYLDKCQHFVSHKSVHFLSKTFTFAHSSFKLLDRMRIQLLVSWQDLTAYCYASTVAAGYFVGRAVWIVLNSWLFIPLFTPISIILLYLWLLGKQSSEKYRGLKWFTCFCALDCELWTALHTIAFGLSTIMSQLIGRETSASHIVWMLGTFTFIAILFKAYNEVLFWQAYYIIRSGIFILCLIATFLYRKTYDTNQELRAELETRGIFLHHPEACPTPAKSISEDPEEDIDRCQATCRRLNHDSSCQHLQLIELRAKHEKLTEELGRAEVDISAANQRAENQLAQSKRELQEVRDNNASKQRAEGCSTEVQLGLQSQVFGLAGENERLEKYNRQLWGQVKSFQDNQDSKNKRVHFLRCRLESKMERLQLENKDLKEKYENEVKDLKQQLKDLGARVNTQPDPRNSLPQAASESKESTAEDSQRPITAPFWFILNGYTILDTAVRVEFDQVFGLPIQGNVQNLERCYQAGQVTKELMTKMDLFVRKRAVLQKKGLIKLMKKRGGAKKMTDIWRVFKDYQDGDKDGDGKGEDKKDGGDKIKWKGPPNDFSGARLDALQEENKKGKDGIMKLFRLVTPILLEDAQESLQQPNISPEQKSQLENQMAVYSYTHQVG